MLSCKEYNKVSGIYQITNIITHQIYIGSAVNLYKRVCNHVQELKKNIHKNKKLQNSWNKYGIDNFYFSVLELVPDKLNLINKEQHYIDMLLQPNNNILFKKIAFNIAKIAGSVLGIKHSDEFRELKREQAYGNTSGLGTKRTDEQREMFRQAQLKRFQTIPKSPNSRLFFIKKTKEELSEVYKKSFTEERRKLISDSNKRRITSNDTRIKRSNSLKGGKRSKESKRKMSDKAKKVSLQVTNICENVIQLFNSIKQASIELKINEVQIFRALKTDTIVRKMYKFKRIE